MRKKTLCQRLAKHRQPAFNNAHKLEGMAACPNLLKSLTTEWRQSSSTTDGLREL